MKNTILLFVLAGILFLTTPADSATSIAVVKFSSRNISSDPISVLTDRLRTELVTTGQFKVYERDLMEKIQEEQGLQQSGLISNEAIVQFGKLIGVQQIVGGTIDKINALYSVNARLVSVETGEIVRTATLDFRGSLDELLTRGMKHVAFQLAGLEASVAPGEPTLEEPSEAAEEASGGFTPFQLALVPGLQLFSPKMSICGVRVNVIGGINKSVYGVDAGFLNFIRQDVYGIQAGFINQSKHVVGFQVGFINMTETMFGLQVGLLNFIHQNRTGARFFPVINLGFSL